MTAITKRIMDLLKVSEAEALRIRATMDDNWLIEHYSEATNAELNRAIRLAHKLTPAH
ncbi:MAG: hypothetical protein IH577_04130 [Deltaproteobacteria bacterium]|nr:hypothetical protein [Deltaproteobacteria bacterium]